MSKAATNTTKTGGQVHPMVMPPPVDIGDLADIFDEQYGNLPVGGFLNPTIESDDGNGVLFRCYYENYDNEDDSWHYGYCRKSRLFYEA